MFPSDLWIASNGNGSTTDTQSKLYQVVNDLPSVAATIDYTEVRSVCVSQDRVSIFVASRNDNVVIWYKKSTDTGELEKHQIIAVGRTPYGMCEDVNGNLWVANYGDNTVMKIKIPRYDTDDQNRPGQDGQAYIMSTVNVDAGPRALVSDQEGMIYVACSLAYATDQSAGVENAVSGGIVDKLTNGGNDTSSDSYIAPTIASKIIVGYNPYAVTCDTKNNIWVANYGSGTVSRIEKGVKEQDIELGGEGGGQAGPYALVADTYGNIYVADYNNDVVVFIDTTGKVDENGKPLMATIPVGDGPNAISITQDDSIYVVDGLGDDVKKIVDKTVVAAIQVCDSPSALGDFTGCATYNAIHVTTTTDITEAVDAVQKDLDNFKAETEKNFNSVQFSIQYLKKMINTTNATVDGLNTKIDQISADVESLESKIDNFLTNIFDAAISIHSIAEHDNGDGTTDPNYYDVVFTVENIKTVKAVTIKDPSMIGTEHEADATFVATYNSIKDEYTAKLPARYCTKPTSMLFIIAVDDDPTHNFQITKTIGGEQSFDSYFFRVGWIATNEQSFENNGSGVKDIKQSVWDAINKNSAEYTAFEVGKKEGSYNMILGYGIGKQVMYIAVPNSMGLTMGDFSIRTFIDRANFAQSTWTQSQFAGMSANFTDYTVYFIDMKEPQSVLITYENYEIKR